MPLKSGSVSTGRFIAAFRSRLKLYAGIMGTAALLAAGISLLLPNWYRAESTMLPPTEKTDTGFGMLSGMIQNSALNNLGLTTTNTPSDVFAEILKSRLLSEGAIRRFGYEKIYHRKGIDRTLKEFRRHLAVQVNSAGLLIVSFEDRNASRAAEVTNFLVSELDRFNVETYKTRGKRLRQFLDGRLSNIQQQLAVSEDRMLLYERTNRVVTPEEKEGTSGMSDILVQKFNLETQRAYVSSYTNSMNPELLSIDRQLGALNDQIGKLPEVKLEGARLALDVQVQRKLFTLIAGQLEDARMQETRDTPTVTVLDVAAAPQLKSRPTRSLVVVAAVLAALVGCAAWTAMTLAQES
jgi:uncharacterized protein involved in exopolysaccharide biosynthesis